MSRQGEHGISWTQETWNPVRGCTRVSQGCVNCYAERVAARFSGPGQPYAGLAKMTPSGPRWSGKVELVEKHLLDPLRWDDPRRVFVNSMSDVFHENLSDLQIDRIFAVMALARKHQFQVLTKRPERMAEYFDIKDGRSRALAILNASFIRFEPGGVVLPLPNVWLGVSVEDQATADERIPLLLNTPAAVRFISAEPLLGPVDLARWSDEGLECECGWSGSEPQATETGPDDDMGFSCRQCGEMCAHIPLDKRLDWVIVGGESGPGARPMHPDWARSLRDQCAAAGVPFHFKQWGEHLPDSQRLAGRSEEIIWQRDPEERRERSHRFSDGTATHRVGKRAAGDTLDGRRWQEFPKEVGA